jgi:multiple sugar transport system substrate-binding protein
LPLTPSRLAVHAAAQTRVCAAGARRPPLLLLVVVAAALSLASCRGSRDTGVLEFWAMGREGEVVQGMVPEFERLHPGVRVRVQQVPWSAAHEKLLTAYVGDATPCVFQLGNTWIPEFAALDAIEPLERRIASSTVVQPADYFPGIYDANVLGGRTYGVPWYIDTRVLFYRDDLLRRVGVEGAPATWDAWVDAMERLRQGDGAGRFAVLLPLTEWQTPVILALQLGADLLRDGGRYGDFESDAFRRAFEFYLDIFRRGLAPRSGDAEVGNLYQDFAAGFFTFYVSGPWNLGEFARRLPPSLDDSWTTAPMPAPALPAPGDSLAGGASLAVFRRCNNPDAAWQWIEFLSAPARQAEFYRLTGDLPARPSAWQQADLLRDRRAVAFWRQLQHVRATPKVPEWERIADKISQYAEAAIRGEMSPAAALAGLDRDVDAILAKRRWLLEKGTGPLSPQSGGEPLSSS